MSDITLNLVDSGMIAITRDTLTGLRNALMRETGHAAAGYLQEAGYTGGPALFQAFRAWLNKKEEESPELLSVPAFQRHASAFFHESGWGSLTVGDLQEVVATLDSSNWSEATSDGGLDHPSCHLTSGMFAEFFGRLAEAPLAVMEVECRSAGGTRCRFLLGSAEVMQQVYEGMSRGAGYEEAVGAAA